MLRVAASVVVGVDGSDEARDAAALARRLVAASGGVVHLVAAAAYPLADVVSTRLRLDTDRLHRVLIEQAREHAQAGLHSLFDSDQLARMVTARLGRPEHVLAEFGREVHADLFVLGGRRHPAPTSWFRRGTAHHLLRVCDQPVVITGPEGAAIERVLAALDVSPAAEPTIRLAAALAALLGVDLEALHVVGRPSLPDQWSPEADLDALIREEEEQAARELWPLLPDQAARRIVRGETVATLRQVLVDEPPTLLVLGAQGRGRVHRLLLGSTTEGLLADPPCALAVVPARATADR
jgi:nucleotide-binding universal stress UspA family protein